MASERVRVHHPPDFIINGKPKWTDIKMTEQLGQTGSSGPEERHVVDRLNPSRNMISSIESQYGESAENTQKVMVNMMTDLRCELVVTLGDARLSEEQENKLMAENRQWEEFKVGLLSPLVSPLEYFYSFKNFRGNTSGNQPPKLKRGRRNQLIGKLKSPKERSSIKLVRARTLAKRMPFRPGETFSPPRTEQRRRIEPVNQRRKSSRKVRGVGVTMIARHSPC